MKPLIHTIDPEDSDYSLTAAEFKEEGITWTSSENTNKIIKKRNPDKLIADYFFSSGMASVGFISLIFYFIGANIFIPIILAALIGSIISFWTWIKLK